MSLTLKPPNSQSLLCLPTSEKVDLLARFMGGFISLLRLFAFLRSCLSTSVEICWD